MNKQDIQTVLDALKTSAHYLIGYSEHREAAITICEAALAEPEGEPSTVLRLIDTIKYLVGIAERGEGRKARDDELPEQFVLGYVKRLEAALAEPSEPVAWTESAIDEYLSDYSLPGDDGDYTPTDDEKFVIKDAIIGFMSPTPETKNSPRIEDIQQAVARGWCSDRNLLKRMDSDLATDIADQVAALLFTHPASKPEPLPKLRDDEIVMLYAEQPQCDADMVEFARAVESAILEKLK